MTKSCNFSNVLIEVMLNKRISRTKIDDQFGQVKLVSMELTYHECDNNNSSCCLSSNSGDQQCNAVCG